MAERIDAALQNLGRGKLKEAESEFRLLLAENANNDRFVGHLDGSLDYPACLSGLADQEITEIRGLYRDEALRVLTLETSDVHLVDKHPLNITELGLVETLFPEAEVIVALRDPRDVCLSNFMQRFLLNNAMANFSNIEDVAGLYAEVMGLWLTYRENTRLKWMEYRYEDLVHDFEATTRAVMTFLEEPWSDDISDFQSSINVRAISTPSYRDVKKPIYDRSIGRWQNYEDQLRPVFDKLAPFVSEFGYAPAV